MNFFKNFRLVKSIATEVAEPTIIPASMFEPEVTQEPKEVQVAKRMQEINDQRELDIAARHEQKQASINDNGYTFVGNGKPNVY